MRSSGFRAGLIRYTGWVDGDLVEEEDPITCTVCVEPPCPNEFAGTPEEAVAAGWTEAENGWQCPIASTTSAELEAAQEGVVSGAFQLPPDEGTSDE